MTVYELSDRCSKTKKMNDADDLAGAYRSIYYITLINIIIPQYFEKGTVFLKFYKKNKTFIQIMEHQEKLKKKEKIDKN